MEKSKIVLEWKKEVGHLITIAADTDGTTEKSYHFWFLLLINFILCFLISNSMLRGIPYTKANANPTAQNQAELSEFVCLGKDGSLIKTDATVSCQ